MNGFSIISGIRDEDTFPSFGRVSGKWEELKALISRMSVGEPKSLHIEGDKKAVTSARSAASAHASAIDAKVRTTYREEPGPDGKPGYRLYVLKIAQVAPQAASPVA